MLTRARVFLLLSITLTSCLFVPVDASQLQPNGQPCEGDCEGQLPACQNAWQPYVSTAFLGRVVSISKRDVPIIFRGAKAATEKSLVTFAVKEVFIGPTEKVVTVNTGGDLCAFPFEKGHEFLVYAKRLSDGELYVSTCYGTKFVEEAAEDLAYFRQLPNAPHGATVYGTAFRYTEPEPLDRKTRRGIWDADHKVTIKGKTQTYQATVDKQGNFRISGLPPGRYIVSLDSTGGISTYPPADSTVDIADKGCAKFNFFVDPYAKQMK
jgi:hypothetical protein